MWQKANQTAKGQALTNKCRQKIVDRQRRTLEYILRAPNDKVHLTLVVRL